ncbi:MAG: hypothetical protein FJY48_08320 [Betaproteobacteria bacterium]|nr:hypothetical protein [Betaproteobacteria bacterium]
MSQFATFASLHPQNHHPDEKVVNQQFFAGLAAAGPESSSSSNTLAYIQNTDPGSNAGLPGLQVPIGLGVSSNLPVGLELDGPAGSDRKLISIGLALENLFGRLPPPAKC